MYLAWQRRREAEHALSWSTAFALVGAGWLTMLAMAEAFGPIAGIPAATGLCWLAAAMLFVHGLRQRARRRDLAPTLAAIWGGIAVVVALRIDLAALQPDLLPATVPVLMATGLTLAAVAVGPRAHRRGWIDWIAMALLLGFAAASLVWMWLLFTMPTMIVALSYVLPGAAVLIYVATGLSGMLLLSDDLVVALERLARTDALTGLWNRRGFDEAAPYLLRKLERTGHTRLAAVAIADIDSFKGINDRHGHPIGDAVLARFAKLLQAAVERGDFLARLGGEEFALLAIGIDGATLLERVERVRQLVRVPDADILHLPSVTVSFGVAQIGPNTLSLRDALERADRALYRAKEEGRDRSILDQLPAPPSIPAE